MEKLSENQQKYLKKVASIADESYDTVFEGMRAFAEKLEEIDPAQADARLLTVAEATARLMVEGGTPMLKQIGMDVLASLEEYKSFLEKYRADQGGVNEEGRDISGEAPEMMPDSLHAALDEYMKGDDMKARANKVSRTLRKKA